MITTWQDIADNPFCPSSPDESGPHKLITSHGRLTGEPYAECVECGYTEHYFECENCEDGFGCDLHEWVDNTLGDLEQVSP